MVKVMQVISKTHLWRRDPAPSVLVCNSHTQTCGRNSQNLVMKQSAILGKVNSLELLISLFEHLNDFLLKIYFVF